MLGRPFYRFSPNKSLTGLTQICGNNSDWSVTISQICSKALIGLSQMPKSWGKMFDLSELCHRFEQLWQTSRSCFHRFVLILSVTYLVLFNVGSLFKWFFAHLSEKILKCSNIYAQGRANLLFSCEIKAPEVSFIGQYFSCIWYQRGCRTRPSIRWQDPNNITDTGARCLA